ncbi:MAG: leucine-rich repeat protein [Clostridia bacterium]|nr:leucine-rich repeat protein [Clostridia bacterium]
MKPIIPKLWMVIAMLWLSISASAYDFEVDGIRYDITSMTELTVSASSLSEMVEPNLVIPESVDFNGKTLQVTNLGVGFAQNNSVIEKVIINADIESISKNAFFGCVNLQSADIKCASRIEYGAFSNCERISELVLSDHLSEIGKYAFSECINLETINLPESLLLLGEKAFQGCSKLNHVDISNVNNIQSSTFEDCVSLSDIQISSKIEEIGSSAFKTTALETFEIPNSVISIGEYVFSNCPKLQSLSIGSGINTISAPLFTECPALSDLSFSDGDNALTFSYTTGDAKFKSSGSSESMGVSAYGCFEGTNIKNVYIGRNLKCGSPRYKAYSVPFLGNGTLETLTIGPKVSNIPLAGMWSGGGDITESTFASYIVGFFQGCENLKKIKILGGGLTSLSNQIFQDCISLQDISFGYMISSIGSNAFENCESLLNLYFYSETAPSYSGEFPNNLYINSKVFIPIGARTSYETTSPWKNFWNLEESADLIAGFTLDGIKYEVLQDHNVQIIGTTFEELSDIILSRTVIYQGQEFILTAISQTAFTGNEYIQSIEISDGIVEIKDNQFKDCINLSKIVLPDNLTVIGANAFMNCYTLTDINIPNTVHSIGDYCFYECKLLSAIDLKDCGISLISNSAFENCEQISIISLPTSVQTIDSRAFKGCKSLLGMNLQNVQYIGDEALSHCESIKSINIPESCMIVGNGAFDGLNNLKRLTIEQGSIPIVVGYSNDLTLSSAITPFPNPSDVDEKRTGFRNGYYDGLFYGLPIEHLVINRDIELPKYYERTMGNSTSSYSTVYNDIVYYPPFYGLTNLKYLEIGENVSAICKNQIEAVVDAVPTTMEYTNFGKCDNIEVVVSNNPNAPIGGGFSQTVYEKAPLFLPNGGLESYKSDDYWKNFAQMNETSFIPIESITFESDEVIIGINESKMLSPIINPSNASIRTLNWSSSNASIIEVSEDGVVTSSSQEGEAVITATACDGTGVTNSIKVIVPEGAGVSDMYSDSNIDISVAEGKLYIRGKADTDTVLVYNVQGQLIISTNDSSINIGSKGIYIVKIDSVSKKVII